jgi:hypothetical protein
MIRSGLPLRRLSGAALLVFQVATFATWEAYESWRAGSASPTHVERAGGHDCPAPHDEALCLVCRVGSDRLLPSLPALPAAALARSRAIGRRPAQQPRATAVTRVGGPRAPPPPHQ